MDFQSLLTRLREAKDLLVSQGPDVLRTTADVLHRVESAIRDAATFLEKQGPNLVFATPESAEVVEALHTLRDECRDLCVTDVSGKMRSFPTKTMQYETQKQGVAMDPVLRSLLAALIANLINQLLSKLIQE